MDSLTGTKTTVDPRRYFEHVGGEPERGAADTAGLPLPGDDQPLQPAVHDLPAHLRRAGAAGRHELGAVHLDRRSDRRASSAPCCTASASRCWLRTCRAWSAT